jgi:hypothetical protein
MRFIVFGGGCYGSYYARQLLRAQAAGVNVSAITVVDYNPNCAARRAYTSPLLEFVPQAWDDFCDDYFGTLPQDSSDQIVPPPFTPHLALGWLLRRLRADRPDLHWSLEPARRLPGTPFQHQSEDGPLTLSHADWICPVNCIEPERCPRTRGPRYWDLSQTVQAWTHALATAGQEIAQTHLFQCLHFAYGVGTYAAARLPEARIAMSGVTVGTEPVRFLVGTVSHCHGAINLIRVAAGTDTVS